MNHIARWVGGGLLAEIQNPKRGPSPDGRTMILICIWIGSPIGVIQVGVWNKESNILYLDLRGKSWFKRKPHWDMCLLKAWVQVRLQREHEERDPGREAWKTPPLNCRNRTWTRRNQNWRTCNDCFKTEGGTTEQKMFLGHLVKGRTQAVNRLWWDDGVRGGLVKALWIEWLEENPHRGEQDERKQAHPVQATFPRIFKCQRFTMQEIEGRSNGAQLLRRWGRGGTPSTTTERTGVVAAFPQSCAEGTGLDSCSQLVYTEWLRNIVEAEKWR